MTEVETSEQNIAWRYIQSTSVNIFLTGKAGTGKTTFLKKVVEESPKRKVVLAPTGVAAINAGGMTLHSFFQLPFGIFLPEFRHLQSFGNKDRFQFQKKKLRMIRSLELIIIDEVSMLRADMMDEIDSVLKKLRRSSQPFGGVQLLMIGDMQQLPPVVKNEEWEIMKKYYSSPYFFDSKVLKENPYISIEFKHIYRQSDRVFIDLLSAVRENRMTMKHFDLLNTRYLPDFKEKDGYIILSTHNSTVRKINDSRLAAIDYPEYTYNATVTGNFPENMYPQDEVLTLKKGAQVMFTKNDPDPRKRYVNGTLAEVTSIDDEQIEVTTSDTGELIEVEPALWENLKYEIDNETKEIKTTVDGLFFQYPLKTAWAITIHKSQGLTFDKAIIDAAYSFSHGQVYVALSRCRSLEGVVLKSKISPAAIINDHKISSFCHEVEELAPSEERLEEDCKKFFFDQLKDLFDLSEIRKNYYTYLKFAKENAVKLYPNGVQQWVEAREPITGELVEVGEKFEKSLDKIAHQKDDNDEYIQERVKKASEYFKNKGIEILLPLILTASKFDFDDKENKKLHRQFLNTFTVSSILKIRLWNKCESGFEINDYLKEKTNLIVEYEGMSETKVLNSAKSGGHIAAGGKDEESERIAESSDIAAGGKDEESERIAESSDIAAGDIEAVSKKKRKNGEDGDIAAGENSDILHPEVFEALRQWRYEKASALTLPAYCILHQRPLIQIANTLPRTSKEFLAIKGIGKSFVEKYAAEVLEIIEKYV